MSHEYRCFRVESAEPYGWVVYLEGNGAETARSHFFVGRSIAIALAQLFAEALSPCRVRLVDLSGRITDEWTVAPRLARN